MVYNLYSLSYIFFNEVLKSKALNAEIYLITSILGRTAGFMIWFRDRQRTLLHCKKMFAIFPSPAGMSLIKLSLDGNNLIIPAPGRVWSVHDIPAGEGKIVNHFLQCVD